MKVTSLGHAGLRIEGANVRLLMDPWLSPSGAFLGSWHQFPSNSHLSVRDLVDCEWVTVSHTHLDHLDRKVLAQLPPTAGVLIPAYPSPVLREQVRASGVTRVVEVAAWDRFELGDGDWLTFIPEQSPMCHDSAVLVSVDGASVLHGNDARLTVGQCRRAAVAVGGHLDVMAVQMSGASWHPICYEYPEEVVRHISAEKRRAKFLAVRRLVHAVQPALAVPFAGPPCFLDPSLRAHNRWMRAPGIFPDPQEAAERLREQLPGQRVAFWLPGDSYDPHRGHVDCDPHWDGFSFDDVDSYLEEYAAARAPELARVIAENPEPDAGLGERFAEHFARLGELNDYFLERIAMIVRFEVEGAGGGRWDVHLGPDRARVDLRGTARDVQYRFRVASRWLAAVIDGRSGWEDLLLSLRFSAWRHPDVYNDYLVGLLKHADSAALGAVEAYEVGREHDERIVVESDGQHYEIGRYCPHAGEDLAYSAVIADGVVRCLGHNFAFDLATGACVNGRCDALPTRKLDVASS